MPFPLRLYPEQKRGLEILGEIMDGGPPVNGLIQTAIERYISDKLKDSRIRAQYEARLSPKLKAVS